MKSAKIKHIAAVLLVTILSLSFTSFVLVSSFKVKYEVSSNDFTEDSAENSKELPKELFDAELIHHLVLLFHPNVTKKVAVHVQLYWPTSEIAPLTPPPDLA